MEESRKNSRSPPVRRTRPKSSSPDEPQGLPPKRRPRKRYSSPEEPNLTASKHHHTRRSSNGKPRRPRGSRESPPPGREFASKRERKRSRSPRPRKSESPKSRSRSYSSGSHSRSRSPDGEEDGARLHVADLGMGITKHDLKHVYEKFGPIQEIWVAKSPPCFAFIVFCLKDDAEDALKSTDGMTLCGSRVRVSFARPRTRGRGSRGFDPNMRCYQCGDKGHFSRDCPDTRYGYKRPPSRSPSRRGNAAGYEGQTSTSRRSRNNGRRY